MFGIIDLEKEIQFALKQEIIAAFIEGDDITSSGKMSYSSDASDVNLSGNMEEFVKELSNFISSRNVSTFDELTSYDKILLIRTFLN